MTTPAEHPLTISEDGQHAHSSHSPEIVFSLRCHPGMVRTENQDRVASRVIPLGDLFLVADGVGGHANGGKAAALAIEGYLEELGRLPAGRDVGKSLLSATRITSQKIADTGQKDAAQPSMGSTIALLLLQGGMAHIGHVGDSRVYRFRNNRLSLLTRDHSVVQRMVDAGVLTTENAQSHPNAHMLTQCLGQTDVAMEVTSHALEAKDVLLVCSDGLWAYVTDPEIAGLLGGGTTLMEAANGLQAQALTAGAPDNVSIVLVSILQPGTAQEKVEDRSNLPGNPIPVPPKNLRKLALTVSIALLLLLIVGGLVYLVSTSR